MIAVDQIFSTLIFTKLPERKILSDFLDLNYLFLVFIERIMAYSIVEYSSSEHLDVAYCDDQS